MGDRLSKGFKSRILAVLYTRSATYQVTHILTLKIDFSGNINLALQDTVACCGFMAGGMGCCITERGDGVNQLLKGDR